MTDTLLLPTQYDIASGIDTQRCLTNDEKDATFYWPADSNCFSNPSLVGSYIERMKDYGNAIRLGKQPEVAATSVEETGVLLNSRDARSNPPSDYGPARTHACLAYCGRFISATFRGFRPPPYPANLNFSTKWHCTKHFPNALVQNLKVAQETLQAIGYVPDKGKLPTGLILLAGSTKSGKSEVARAISLEAIRLSILSRFVEQGLKSQQRMPHFVTYEDPIEQWQIYDENFRPVDLLDVDIQNKFLPSVNHGFCFTPRQSNVDVSSLQDALLDAKRQTPTCFYVGEVRRASDWRAVFEFAGSGHLVVATTHAGSLVGMIARVLKAMKATSPHDRRTVASQLLACLHLQLPTNDGTKVMLPSMWCRNGVTLSSLVGDGLSSIVPNGESIRNRQQSLEYFCEEPTDEDHKKRLAAAIILAKRIDLEELRSL